MVLQNGAVVIDDSLGVLADTLTLSGQDGLVDGKAVALNGNNSAVGRNAVTNRYRHNIARDEVVGLDSGDVAAVADDIGFVGRIFLEGSNGFFGAAFLRDSDDGVEDENREDLHEC